MDLVLNLGYTNLFINYTLTRKTETSKLTKGTFKRQFSTLLWAHILHAENTHVFVSILIVQLTSCLNLTKNVIYDNFNISKAT